MTEREWCPERLYSLNLPQAHPSELRKQGLVGQKSHLVENASVGNRSNSDVMTSTTQPFLTLLAKFQCFFFCI